MSESFCVLYQDVQHRRPVKKLSMAYESLGLAINAAFNIAQREFELLEIRGSDGSHMGKADLDKALIVAAA